MTGITVKTWPRGIKSLTEAALRHCLGDDPVLQAFDSAPVEKPVVMTQTEPAGGGARNHPAQIPGRRYLVEYDDFPLSVIRRFDQSVSKGEAEDSAAGFRRFASEDYSHYTAFVMLWVNSEFVQDQIVINTTDLVQTPLPWLHWVLGMLNPGQPPIAGQLDRISSLAPDWMADRAATHSVADLRRFRHYDAAFFAQLARFGIRRDVVQRIFHETMGRVPEETAIVHFQGLDSAVALRRALLESKEYARRQARAIAAFGRYDTVTPEILCSTAYHRVEMSRKNELRWPLTQVFISRKAGVIYCPIGKVACTFLKRQMVQISDVAHKKLLLDRVHLLTDLVRTGLQLSDYPEAEARGFMNSPDIVKFAVLRDPRDRLLSAYIEKFVINRINTGNLLHTGPVIIAVQQGKGLVGLDAALGITFRDFITQITALPSYRLDPHWRPQADYLDGIRYDRLFRFDAMDAVIDLLEARSGQILSRQPQNVTGSGSGAVDIAAADLLPGQILALPRLDKSCFFDDDLNAAIAAYFDADLALLQTIKAEALT